MKKILLVFLILVIVVVGGYFIWLKFLKKEQTEVPTTTKVLDFIDTGKFGFLLDPRDEKTMAAVKKIGAGWLRPHPGEFIWDDMQKGEESPVEFEKTDEEIQKAQKE